MKLKTDREADALYLTLDDATAVELEEVSPGIIVDYNDHNQAVEIEMLYLSKRVPKLNASALQFETL